MSDEHARLISRLAEECDVEALARMFASMPLREILSVRVILHENGTATTVVDALLRGLEHRNARIRHDCAHALDHLADERCYGPLLRLLDDPVARVRRMALHSLSCPACKLVSLTGDSDLAPLIIERATHDPSVNVRRHAVVALADHAYDPRAARTLQALAAGDEDPVVRRNAQRAVHCGEA